PPPPRPHQPRAPPRPPRRPPPPPPPPHPGTPPPPPTPRPPPPPPPTPPPSAVTGAPGTPCRHGPQPGACTRDNTPAHTLAPPRPSTQHGRRRERAPARAGISIRKKGTVTMQAIGAAAVIPALLIGVLGSSHPGAPRDTGLSRQRSSGSGTYWNTSGRNEV